jgi:hypothetical protein
MMCVLLSVCIPFSSHVHPNDPSNLGKLLPDGSSSCVLTFPLILMVSSLSRWAGHWEGEIQDYWWWFGFCLRRIVWLLNNVQHQPILMIDELTMLSVGNRSCHHYCTATTLANCITKWLPECFIINAIIPILALLKFLWHERKFFDFLFVE